MWLFNVFIKATTELHETLAAQAWWCNGFGYFLRQATFVSPGPLLVASGSVTEDNYDDWGG